MTGTLPPAATNLPLDDQSISKTHVNYDLNDHHDLRNQYVLPLSRYFVKDGTLDSSPPPPIPIPVIDLSLLFASQSTINADLELGKLKDALTNWGCFQAIGHGIPNSLLDRVRKVSKQFFTLPLKEKQKYAKEENDNQGFGTDRVFSDKQVIDWCNRLMLLVLPDNSRKPQLWPENPANFREILEEYSSKIEGLAEMLLKTMAKTLNLEENCFLKQFGENSTMSARINYYPECPRPDLVLGVKAHSDGSGVTILLQDEEIEGLQVFKDGKWSLVPIIPHALVVNIGDQLQIMSNDILKSPLHRVSVSNKDRVSIAMFLSPDPEVEIGPVKELIDETRPQIYKYIKGYGAINIKCFQNGEVPLETIKIN